MQIEIMRLVNKHVGGKCLIVAPLGVRQEFRRDGEKLGVEFKFIRRDDEIEHGHAFYLTNYESVRDGKLNPLHFDAVSLDEASVLRSYGSKTYQEFLPLFDGIQFKFVCTATPSPNRYKELIHYAGFLSVMDTGQAFDAVLPARQHASQQPDVVPAQGARILVVAQLVGDLPAATV